MTMCNAVTTYDGGAEYAADSAAPSDDGIPAHHQHSTTTTHDGGAEYSADSAAPSDDDTRAHRLCNAATTYDGGADYSVDSAAPSDDDTPVDRQCSTTTIRDGGAEYSADSAAPSDDDTPAHHQRGTTTIHDGGAEHSADSAAPSDDDTRVHRQCGAATADDCSAEYSVDSAAPATDEPGIPSEIQQPSSWATHTTTSITTTTITTAATRTTRNRASPAAQPRTVTYFVPTRTQPTPTPQPDLNRENGNYKATTDSTTPATADKTKLSPELQQLTDSLQSMGQNIAQNFRQNINQLTQATADQAGILGRETQEMVNTTLADQHQRYAESAQRVKQNIDAINNQYLGDTQRQGRRIDQVASLIDAAERNLEDRLERVQLDIQAHAQNVARVHRESQRRADTRPDTPTQKAPPIANYVPQRQPQSTVQTRPDPKDSTNTNPTSNQPAKPATRQVTNQPSPDEQPRGALPKEHQNTGRATPLANSTADEEAAPPLTRKELWQGTESVRKLTGTFTPKEAAYDGTKEKHHEEFASFANRFEYMANYYQIPKANWAHMFATCLATSAHDEYLAMSKEQQNDFSQTVEHLSKIYPAPTRNEWTYRTQWDALRQAPNEPLREFIARIESLAHKAHTSRNAQGLEYEKIMKFRYGMASSSLRYDMAAVMADTLQELGSRAIAIQMSRDADPATMRIGTTEMSEVARDLGTVPTGMIRTAQLEPQHPMGEVTRLPYAYPHIMPPATTCITYVPASSFAVPVTPPPPTPSYNPPTQPPPGHPQGSEQRRQQPKDEGYPKKRRGDYQRGMDLAFVQCYNCGERGHLANKCPRPDKRLRPGYRGANRGRGSRSGNRANSYTDNRQSSDAPTPLAPTTERQNMPLTEQSSATQDSIARQYRAHAVSTNADLDPSTDDAGFDLLMSSDSRRAMIRFASADLTSPRSKSPSMHTQAHTTEEETEQFQKSLSKQGKLASAPPATVHEVPKPFGVSAGYDPCPFDKSTIGSKVTSAKNGTKPPATFQKPAKETKVKEMPKRCDRLQKVPICPHAVQRVNIANDRKQRFATTHYQSCQNCLGAKDAHGPEAVETAKACRKLTNCGFLYTAPENIDSSIATQKNKRGQKRWFCLYDDGEWTRPPDQHPDTIPHGCLDRTYCTEVTSANAVTQHANSVVIAVGDERGLAKADTADEIRWRHQVLSMYPKQHAVHRSTDQRSFEAPEKDSFNGEQSEPQQEGGSSNTGVEVKSPSPQYVQRVHVEPEASATDATPSDLPRKKSRRTSDLLSAAKRDVSRVGEGTHGTPRSVKARKMSKTAAQPSSASPTLAGDRSERRRSNRRRPARSMSDLTDSRRDIVAAVSKHQTEIINAATREDTASAEPELPSPAPSLPTRTEPCTLPDTANDTSKPGSVKSQRSITVERMSPSSIVGSATTNKTPRSAVSVQGSPAAKATSGFVDPSPVKIARSSATPIIHSAKSTPRSGASFKSTRSQLVKTPSTTGSKSGHVFAKVDSGLRSRGSLRVTSASPVTSPAASAAQKTPRSASVTKGSTSKAAMRSKPATPASKASTPVSRTPGSKSATPGSKVASPAAEVATLATKAGTPASKVTTPGSRTATPATKVSPPVASVLTPATGGRVKALMPDLVDEPSEKVTHVGSPASPRPLRRNGSKTSRAANVTSPFAAASSGRKSTTPTRSSAISAPSPPASARKTRKSTADSDLMAFTTPGPNSPATSQLVGTAAAHLLEPPTPPRVVSFLLSAPTAPDNIDRMIRPMEQKFKQETVQKPAVETPKVAPALPDSAELRKILANAKAREPLSVSPPKPVRYSSPDSHLQYFEKRPLTTAEVPATTESPANSETAERRKTAERPNQPGPSSASPAETSSDNYLHYFKKRPLATPTSGAIKINIGTVNHSVKRPSMMSMSKGTDVLDTRPSASAFSQPFASAKIAWLQKISGSAKATDKSTEQMYGVEKSTIQSSTPKPGHSHGSIKPSQSAPSVVPSSPSKSSPTKPRDSTKAKHGVTSTRRPPQLTSIEQKKWATQKSAARREADLRRPEISPSEAKELSILEPKQQIMTETNLVASRRTIYPTLQPSLDYNEAAHKLLKPDIKPSMASEWCDLFLDTCTQQRTYERFYELITERFCRLRREYQQQLERISQDTCSAIHRSEIKRLRNVARLFSHLFRMDAISRRVTPCIKLNEDDTTSSGRIFLKVRSQDIAENMGVQELYGRFRDPTMSAAFEGIFPRDNPRDTCFAINYSVSIDLGGPATGLQDFLMSAPKQPVPGPSLSSESDSTESSSSDSSESDADPEPERKPRQKSSPVDQRDNPFRRPSPMRERDDHRQRPPKRGEYPGPRRRPEDIGSGGESRRTEREEPPRRMEYEEPLRRKEAVERRGRRRSPSPIVKREPASPEERRQRRSDRRDRRGRSPIHAIPQQKQSERPPAPSASCVVGQ